MALLGEGEVSPQFIQLVQQFFFLTIFKGIQVTGCVFALLQGDDGIAGLILEFFFFFVIGQGCLGIARNFQHLVLEISRQFFRFILPTVGRTAAAYAFLGIPIGAGLFDGITVAIAVFLDLLIIKAVKIGLVVAPGTGPFAGKFVGAAAAAEDGHRQKTDCHDDGQFHKS